MIKFIAVLFLAFSSTFAFAGPDYPVTRGANDGGWGALGYPPPPAGYYYDCHSGRCVPVIDRTYRNTAANHDCANVGIRPSIFGGLSKNVLKQVLSSVSVGYNTCSQNTSTR